MEFKKSQKLSLETVKIQSFITSEGLYSAKTIKGGTGKTSTVVPPHSAACPPTLSCASGPCEGCNTITVNVSKGSI